jgi:hypothetical protein
MSSEQWVSFGCRNANCSLVLKYATALDSQWRTPQCHFNVTRGLRFYLHTLVSIPVLLAKIRCIHYLGEGSDLPCGRGWSLLPPAVNRWSSLLLCYEGQRSAGSRDAPPSNMLRNKTGDFPQQRNSNGLENNVVGTRSWRCILYFWCRILEHHII